jgi:restriction system protein
MDEQLKLPKHNELRFPILKELAEGKELTARNFVNPLQRHFDLSAEQLSLMYESGNGPVFYDRISWALSFLYRLDAVDKPRRGSYIINDKGRQLLTRPDCNKFLVKERLSRRLNQQSEIENNDSGGIENTPQEQLSSSFENIRQTIYDEIIDTILSKSPRAFEFLVVKLMEKMGYGGQIKNAGLVTQFSNDGGIDGVIKEDILGLGRIHIQAKRYDRKNVIGREDVQNFVGALAVAQSNKGVFITTSKYSKGAIDFVGSLNGNTTIVLIDGLALAKHIYDFNLGMQLEQVIEIKRLDGDFWDAIQD